MSGFCDTFEVTVDGIQYTCDTETHEATAIGLSDKSIVLLEFPATITVEEVVYNVTCVSRINQLANLEEIRFPEGLKYIGEKDWGGVFSDCPKLKKINFPSTMIALTPLSFSDCPLTETDLTIPSGFTNANRVDVEYRSLLSESFRGTQLRSVAVAPGNTIFTYDDNGVIIDDYTDPYGGIRSGKYVVLACSSATVIPEGVEYVGGEVFRNHKDITTISFPSTYKGSLKMSDSKIERYNPFRGCTGLTTITVSASNPDFESRGTALIYKPLLELVGGCNATIIPDDIKIIGENAFRDCTFNTIEIPQSVTEIKEWSFHDCRNLESITIPENVTAIGRSTFGNCPALTSMKFKMKKPISLPTGNVNDKEACLLFFGTWTQLTANPTLYVPVGTKKAYESAKWYEVFKEIVEDETLGYVVTTTDNGDGTVTVGTDPSAPDIVEIPEQVGGKDVTAIGDNTFAGKTNVTDIYLPETDQALTLGDDALKIDDDHVATVHVPLSLLVDYALNEELKQNFEAGKVVATITAPNQYWTFSSGVDVLVPDGVKVYICKAINGSDIQIVELTDAELTVDGKKVIKANNGVLISSTSGNAYDLVAKSGAQASGTIPAAFENANSYEGNKLVPVVRSQNYDPDQYYMLYNGGFVKIADGDVSKTPACRALLKK